MAVWCIYGSQYPNAEAVSRTQKCAIKADWRVFLDCLKIKETSRLCLYSIVRVFFIGAFPFFFKTDGFGILITTAEIKHERGNVCAGYIVYYGL